MKRNQLLDLFIQSQLQQAKMPSVHFNYQRVDGKVVVTFSGDIAMAHADSLAMQFFPIEKQLNVDIFCLTSKGAAFGVLKQNGIVQAVRTKKGRGVKPSEDVAAASFLDALQQYIDSLCERIAHDIEQILETGLEAAITKDIMATTALVKDIEAVLGRQCA